MNSVIQLKVGREAWALSRPLRAPRMQAQPDLGPILAHAPVAMLLLSMDLRCLSINEAMARLVGRPPRVLNGRKLADVLPDAVQLAARSVTLHMAGHEIPDQEITWLGRRYRLSANPVQISGSGAQALIVAAVDVTRHHRIQQRLRQSRRRLAKDVRQDHLTGLLNRRALETELKREIRAALRARTPLSVLIADVDWFKAYNDQLGHLEGDACLRSVAEELACCIRRTGGLACRYGGEEFLAILPDMDERGARMIAERFRVGVAALCENRPLSVRREVTVSIGVATFDPQADDTWADSCQEALLKAADDALYRAKAQGRNQVRAATRQFA